MAVNKQMIEHRIQVLNRRLGRPANMFADSVTSRMNTGHIYLDKNSSGYQLEEISSESGSARALSSRLSKKEIFIFVDGMVMGVEAAQEYQPQVLPADV